jgi:hypothetical protein
VLELHRSVMTRLAAQYKLSGAESDAAAARKLLGEKELTARIMRALRASMPSRCWSL